MRQLSAVIAAAALLLAGCTPAAEAPPATITTPTPTPTPTPTVATENQVATVIAGIEPDMRAVIDGAGDCRLLHTLGAETPADEANLAACYAAEVTAGMQAKTAVEQLGKLTVPSSMTTLATDMIDALNGVANIDLAAKCGEPFTTISDSGECSYALGQRFTAYLDLEGELDKWAPYLT